MIELVGVAGLLVGEPNWCHISIFPVRIVSNKNELAEVVVVAAPAVPGFIEITVFVSLRDTLQVSDNLERFFSVEGLRVALELRLLERENDVERCCARETNTVIDIVPCLWWVHDEGHSVLMHISEGRVVKVLHWQHVRLVLADAEYSLLGTAQCLVSGEINEINSLAVRFGSPCTVRLNFVKW